MLIRQPQTHLWLSYTQHTICSDTHFNQAHENLPTKHKHQQATDLHIDNKRHNHNVITE